MNPYAPRPVTVLPLREVGRLRLKVYHIGAEPPTDARFRAVETELTRLPNAVAAEGEDHGLGFVIAHEGEVGCWLLMHWWAHGDILCQRLSLDDGSGFLPVDDRPLMACVWELPIIGHERDAWVRTMMTERPDPDAYLADAREQATV